MANNESIAASISGTDVEAENRIENDRLLLTAIEIERDERMKATREIHDKLRKHEVALNVAIGLATGLLISMMLIAWQMLN